MVSRYQTEGLIVSVAALRSAAIDELIACCGWPVLLEASAVRLRRDQRLRSLECLLFWVEESRHVAATANLLACERQQEPRVRRIALAHGLGHETEAALRAAGAHAYFTTAGNIAVGVEQALGWLRDGEIVLCEADAVGLAANHQGRLQSEARKCGQPARPP